MRPFATITNVELAFLRCDSIRLMTCVVFDYSDPCLREEEGKELGHPVSIRRVSKPLGSDSRCTTLPAFGTSPGVGSFAFRRVSSSPSWLD